MYCSELWSFIFVLKFYLFHCMVADDLPIGHKFQESYNTGDYINAIVNRQKAETISYVLYPDDRSYQVKCLCWYYFPFPVFFFIKGKLYLCKLLKIFMLYPWILSFSITFELPRVVLHIWRFIWTHCLREKKARNFLSSLAPSCKNV